jgi:hypothetical protein
MQRLLSSSELDRQRRDWHHALVRAEIGDKPYLSADDQAYRTMRPGAYLVEMQRNRNNALITYTWISDEQALKIMEMAEKDRDAAVELMAKAVA